ncbi:MAG: hypothetical protein JW731_03920 [Bacteroidales bacterium]|nr:hypothetical protein [Bacteroidales bacterium]
MKNSFTPNDLILFAYSDTKGTRERKFYEEMQADEHLLKEFQNILGVKFCIDSSIVAPQKRTINNLLSYSRAMVIFKTNSIGTINKVMN